MAELKHYGMPRRSGRYPWGSGDDAYQRSAGWRKHYKDLKSHGLSDVQIAEGEGINTNQLRKRNTISREEVRAHDRNRALQLKDKGYSDTEIGRQMDKNESSIRSLLDPVLAERASITRITANMLRESVDKERYIDIGVGIENHIGVTRTKLNSAVSILQEEGYKVHNVNVPQLGMPGKFTIMKVLGAPDTVWNDLRKDTSQIKSLVKMSDDGGRSFRDKDVFDAKKIQYVNPDRVKVRYAEEGGIDKDGVMELRRGVSDLDLGGSQYAQVRIGVGGTHFLKGMAIYSDNLDDGVDIVFNTNKKSDVGKMKAMKELKKDEKTGIIDPDNPFGASIKLGGQRGALNIVNEEGDWDTWSKTISSQILSKQTVPLAKEQLTLTLKQKQEQYDDIMAFNNPVIKRQLLLSFADDADSSSVHLKAAALPRQSSKVILPIPELKPTEVYAPTYNNGDTVVLIRHPHGGTFEIPQLTVNNKSKAAKAVMNQATDAIGIHPSVAQKLSGADFDGDSVIVIPNNNGKVRASKPSDEPASIKSLANFDTREAYPPYHGLKTIDGGIYNAETRSVEYGGKKPVSRTKQTKMGEISNLITDMTIKGANLDEVARAVKHSMVVIDSEKHHLDYKRSYEEQGIASLCARYQNSSRGGASTLVSKASSEKRVNEFKPRAAKDGGPIDPKTGKKMYTPTGENYAQRKPRSIEDGGPIDPLTGKKMYTLTGKTIYKQTKTTKMEMTDDAHTLSSGRPIEEAYADYANSLKSLANTARKNALATAPTPYSPEASKVYAHEVSTLNANLNIALKNKPVERQAQIIANSIVDRKKLANPDMDEDDLKKVRNRALIEARVRTGAHKHQVPISDKEWEAIQAGAITTSKLTQILQNTDMNRIKQLATPRTTVQMSPTRINRAKDMLDKGYTQAEVAESLGVSTATLTRSIK